MNKHIDDISHETQTRHVDLAKFQAWFLPMMVLLIGLSNILVIYIGGNQFISGKIELGILAEFIIYVNMLTWPVATVGWVTSIVQQAEASQARINQFLKEKINLITLTSIILAITGVLLMVGNSLSPGELSGNLAAFTMPITFAILIMIVRKYPSVDMIPAQFVAGISSCLIGFLLSTKIMISPHDIFLGFLAGFFQIGFGFIFITIGARTTPSATVGIIMLSESVLGPLWAFLFVSERPSIFALVGGAVILSAVLLQFYSLLSKNKKSVSH